MWGNHMPNTQILTLSCEDRPGLVATVAGLLAENGCNILESQQFNDVIENKFFMRVVFDVLDSTVTVADIHRQVESIAQTHTMHITMQAADTRRKVLILVSKFDHCLADLLYRVRIGELNMDVVGIVSNHPRQALTLNVPSEIPYHYLPVKTDLKTEQESQIKRIVEDTGAELIILARYMQILSDDFSAYLSGRCINIHHSFLPGFKGAKPYHQAYARGVKMIGATAHYVTDDLDEGPIIVQDVEAITHADSPDDLVRKGRDIERRVLALAVRHHLENRLLINGNRTVVFRT